MNGVDEPQNPIALMFSLHVTLLSSRWSLTTSPEQSRPVGLLIHHYVWFRVQQLPASLLLKEFQMQAASPRLVDNIF